MAVAVTPERIAEELQALGVRSGALLMAHTSLRSFGHVEGGALGVIQGMAEAVGPLGTLAFPTLTGRREDGPADPPVFELETTPCWTGRVPETARTLPGAVRSAHPTHSVTALGPRAAWLTEGHLEAPSPCGVGTPYARLAAEGGQVVLFGVDLNRCTLVHGIEEVAGVPYHLQAKPTEVRIRMRGTTVIRALRLHVWDDTWKDFNRLAPEAEAHGALRRGHIGEAGVTVIDAAPFWALGVCRLLKDPLFLVRDPPA